MPAEIVVPARVQIEPGVSQSHAATLGQLPPKPLINRYEGFGNISYQINQEAAHIITMNGDVTGFSINGWNQTSTQMQQTVFVFVQDVNGNRSLSLPPGIWLAPPGPINTEASKIAIAFIAYTFDGGTTVYYSSLSGPDLTGLGGGGETYVAGNGLQLIGTEFRLDPSVELQLSNLATQVEGLQNVTADPLGTVSSEAELLALDNGNLNDGDYAFLNQNSGSRVAGVYIWTNGAFPTTPSAFITASVSGNSIPLADTPEIDLSVVDGNAIFSIIQVPLEKITVTGEFDMLGQRIVDVGDPIAEQDVVTKAFFDANATPTDRLPVVGSDTVEVANINGSVVIDVASGSIDTSHLNIDADLDAQTNRITNLADPVDAQDAVTKQYVTDTVSPLDRVQIVSSDTVEVTSVPGEISLSVPNAAIGTDQISIQADLDLGGNKITGLADPVDNQDAVTKRFFDLNATATERRTFVSSETVEVLTDSNDGTVLLDILDGSLGVGHMTALLQNLIGGISFGTSEIGLAQVRTSMPVQYYNDTGSDIEITTIRAFLNDAPIGADLRAEVVVDGNVEHTIIVADGTSTKVETVSFIVPNDGQVQIRVTQIGTTQAGSDFSTHFRGVIQ